MGSAASPLPYQNITTTSDLPQWKKELYGFTKNAPAYSPFKALSRQAGTEAKMIEGMTTRPSWSSMYEAMGVPQGQDLTPYIQAMRTGTQAPQAPIPASPAAGDIPAFIPPSEETKKAAHGGLMSLAKKRGFASGGSSIPQDLTKAEASRLQRLNARVGYGQTLSPKDQRQLDAYTAKQQAYQTYQNQQKTDTSAPTAVPLSQAMNVVTPFYDVKQQYGQYGGVTNPIYQQAIDQLRTASKTPEQFQQATGIMSSAADRLMQQAGYTPQQIDAEKLKGTASQMAQYQQVAAQKADTERAAAAAMNRGDVREVNALMAQVEKYNAALMNAPADIQAQAYQAAQTQGPKSWTDPGVARQYMNPYQQAVTDQELFEANRQAQMRENQQRSQATQQKAFGGTRAALQESEGRRNLGYLLSDIQSKGSQQAYQSGMGQFQAEQGLGSQVSMANTQALNQQRSQYVSQALEAAKNNYGGQLTAAQQNQVAQNAAAQFNAAAQNLANNNYVAQQLQAQLANQQMDFGVGQLNTQNQQQTNLANAAAANQAAQQYAQLNLQGQLANQQAGLTTEQQNAQLRQQMGLANQQAGLQAAIQNQQAGLSAQGLNLQALNQAGQMGQGIGSLGSSMWGLQQNIPQLWGAAGQTVQNIAQQAATGAQQTAQNWWGGMNNAYAPVTNMLTGTPGTTGTQNTARLPGV